MIDLSIYYKSNQDGGNLLKLIKENFEQVKEEIIKIGEQSFFYITIKNEASKFTRILNPPQAQINCINKEIMFQILGQNNVAYKRKSRELITRYYEILVFDIYVISIKETIPAKVKRAVSYVKKDRCLKAAELSKKAAYHLGLNCAMVKVALTASKQYMVIDVEPSPNIRPMDLVKLISKFKRILNDEALSANDREVKLGADPEFMLSRNSKMIPASIYFPHHGRVGCDNIRTRNRQQHPIGELRPQPNVSPLKLAENVKTALYTALRLAPSRKIKWIAGSQPFKGYPIGGHIHFSNIKLNFAVLRALDNFLAIPMLLIEAPGSGVLRRKKYGALADYRVKKYGGFEYRTLGSWLVSREITGAVLCLAKIIVSHYLELNQNYLDTLEAQQAFYKGDKEYFKPIFTDIWQTLCQTNLYNEYADTIQIIQVMINDGIIWNEKDDLRKAWGMPNFIDDYWRKKQKTKKNRIQTTRNNRPNNSHIRNGVASRERHNSSPNRNRGSGHNLTRSSSAGFNNTTIRTESNTNEAGHGRFNMQSDRFRSSYTTTLH